MDVGRLHAFDLLPRSKDELRVFDVPFRRTVSGLFDGAAGDRDFVYFVAADSRYVKRFARALHSSLAAVRANCLLHIHVINPDAAASLLLGYMKERPGPMVAVSSEEVDLSGLSDDQRRVYYASARFFILSALRRHYDKPVIAADIDQVVLRDPAPLIEPGSDVAAIRFPYGRFNLMARFSASAVIAAPLRRRPISTGSQPISPSECAIMTQSPGISIRSRSTSRISCRTTSF